jgi:hypothetical protein
MLNSSIAAITVWPADEQTAELFAHSDGVGDKEGKLDPITNMDLIRWLKPSQVQLLNKV